MINPRNGTRPNGIYSQELVDKVLESCNNSYVRIIVELDKIEKAVLKLTDDSHLVKMDLKRIIRKCKEIISLIDLLNLPEIYDPEVSSVGRGCWVARKINCGKCKRCKANPKYFIHGPYLYKVVSESGETKQKYMGRVDKAVLSILESRGVKFGGIEDSDDEGILHISFDKSLKNRSETLVDQSTKADQNKLNKN